jgi:dipeptidyl aminopeptidase/acylaminoacyl peptidase
VIAKKFGKVEMNTRTKVLNTGVWGGSKRPFVLVFLVGWVVFAAVSASPLLAATASLEQVLGYPYVSELVSSEMGDRFAWVEDVRGVRNIWFSLAAKSDPHQLTHYGVDDGQELTQLTFSHDGSELLYVRGGDHDANWAAQGNLAPNPENNTSEPKVAIWSVYTGESKTGPVQVAEGDSPALSSKGQLAYVKEAQIWTAPLPSASGAAPKPERLFFDHGKDDSPKWSADGTQLAFVSGRGDHSFVGVYSTTQKQLLYLGPSTNFDSNPVWSPDGTSIAFMREPSLGDAVQNFLVQRPHPFAFWIGNVATGKCHKVWNSPETLAGSLPNLAQNEPLFWMADSKLVFLAETDNWPHLYSVDLSGGEARLLTPGNFMVENVVPTPDHRSLVYSANTGSTKGDEARRHLFQVGTGGGSPVPLTSGASIEWSPAALAAGSVAYITAEAKRPAVVSVRTQTGASQLLDTGSAKDYPSEALVIPKLVSFRSPDGLSIQGQLFQAAGASTKQPGVIFVHGGPPRQMMLGWHYMAYYSNAYAVNQYLAAHGFTVLSVNYRLGIGYGRAFQHPEHAGPAGASEYQDVLAGARYLQQVAGVDAKRIGIWGGSYGGYLTGLGLARNSDVFKAGVDFHGLSNWVPTLQKDQALPEHWWEVSAEWKQAVATAFAASPDADIAKWKSPVLLIHGDDDRNVPFDQTVELAHRLEQQHTPFEELIIPNEIHGFLRYANWLLADQATVDFLQKQLGSH